MGLHKMVNGVRVDCTPEEEEQIKAEWEANRIKNEEKKQRRIAEMEEKENHRKSAIQKLQSMGLSKEEIDALIESKKLAKEGS